MKRFLAMILCLIMAVGLLAGCGNSSSTETPAAQTEAPSVADIPEAVASDQSTVISDEPVTVEVDENKTLVIAISDTMTSLEVTNNKSAGQLLEQAMVIQTLVGINSNFDIYPVLATEWTRSGELTWEFKLREGVTFHDGTPFNAEAVKWDFDLIGANADSFATTCKVASTRVVDEYTIEITTTKPTVNLPECLTHKMAAIIAPTSYDADGNFVKPVGTGYFQFESFDDTASELSVIVYDNYWGGPQNSSIYRRIIRTISDPSTRALAASNHEVDISFDVPFSELAALMQDSTLSVQRYNTARTYQTAFNIQSPDTKPYLQDVRVRQALIYAINRQEILDTLLFGVGGVPHGLYSEIVPWANTDVNSYQYDPDTAIALLEEAGMVDVDGDGYREYNGESVNIVIMCGSGRPGMPLIAQAMQGYYDAIGLHSEAKVLDGNTQNELREKGEYDISFNSFATCMIPTTYYYLEQCYVTGTNIAKRCGYSNPELDELVAKCVAAEDKEEQYALSRQAQQIANDDAVIFTVMLYGTVFINDSRVTGFDYSPAVHDFIVPITTDLAD